MRALTIGLAAVLLTGVAVAPPAAAKGPKAVEDVVRFVDPLIGSANGGNTYPGAVRPFGMISWSPTSTRGDQTNTGAANGYAYDATRVRGFGLTHVNGAGCHPGAAGDVPIMPFVGDVTSSPTADVRDEVYASDFRHEDESATPGRYRVALASGASADLAVTTRAGIGDFAFPKGAKGSLLFRVSNSLNGSEDAEVTIDPAARTVSGSVLTGAFCGRRANGGANNKKTYYRLYFTASFDRAFAANGTWVDGALNAGATSAHGGEGYETGAARAGRGSGGYVTFDTASDDDVRVRVGISYTSADAAKRNLAKEIGAGDDVDSVAADAGGSGRGSCATSRSPAVPTTSSRPSTPPCTTPSCSPTCPATSTAPTSAATGWCTASNAGSGRSTATSPAGTSTARTPSCWRCSNPASRATTPSPC
ncbi:glycosyl hydrolase family 92 [Umezawaea tangerina]|uniref:Glycosyl hydrolase family 92 n=1 Tax=Umezawaea tangerina TaxID=84725 RepID=A0A2T0SE42_9PSEU|nr:glycosyl hydrolase family 92 [Umezawaea tangerina]